jgi:hypothetical protein
MFATHFATIWAVALFLSALQQPTPIQVLRISAGTSGSEKNGVFVLTDERTVFSRSADREVIVFFEWEHVPGPHKLVAQWRSPAGDATASSTIDYDAANKRFGAYWRLPLVPDTALGLWSVDATMDGRPAGRFTFEITDKIIDVPHMKRPLTESEIYNRLAKVFVVIRRTLPDGRELDGAAGFVADPVSGLTYTVISAIDATHALHALIPDGTLHPISQLVAFSRKQQWAVVGGRPVASESLPISRAQMSEVGSRCYSIEGTPAGVRVIITGTITGQVTQNTGVRTLIATFPSAFGMPGAPVVNEYGELIGLVGVGLPGDPRSIEQIIAARGSVSGVPVIPVPPPDVLQADPSQDIGALRASGALMAPVTGGAHIATAGFTRDAPKRGELGPSTMRDDLSLAEKSIYVLVSWAPADRLRGQAAIRVFDADNNLIAESPGRKVNFRKGNYTQWSWDVPMMRAPGLYRFDLVVDTTTYWRGFLRVNP